MKADTVRITLFLAPTVARLLAVQAAKRGIDRSKLVTAYIESVGDGDDPEV